MRIALPACLMLARCSPALALNPALDVSQYVHTAWRIREGFIKSPIECMAQTPDGYLWLGTEFGLFRFDGIRITPWQPPSEHALSSGAIRSLLVTRDGTLWIGTLTGLASWKSGTLTSYAAMAGMLVGSLLESRDGTVWAGGSTLGATQRAMLCSIHDTQVHCDAAAARVGPYVAALHEDRGGRLWVGSANGLWSWKPDPPEFYLLSGEPNGIRGFADADDGGLVIPTRGTLRRWAAGAFVQSVPMPPRAGAVQVRHSLRDRDGGIWIGTIGAGVVHHHSGRVDVFGESDGLSGDAVSSLFGDREGNVWVATSEGLDRFREPIVATFSPRQGLSNSWITSVLATRDGGVWLGSFEGLNRWFDGRNTIYHEAHLRTTEWPLPDGVREITGRGLPAHGVHALGQDHLGRLWVSTRTGVGVIENDRWTTIPGFPVGNFNAIVEDSTNTVWIAHDTGGLFKVPPGGMARRVRLAELLGHEDGVSALAADPVRGGVWTGFVHGGIARLTDGAVGEAYAASDGLSEGRVNAFLLDGDGTLWSATQNGLSVLRGGRIRTLTSRDGLPCDGVHWVIEDDAHDFWLLMPCGLVRVARTELESGGAVRATSYDHSDGIAVATSSGSYTPSVSKSSDGRLWFRAPYGGVDVLDPRHFPSNTFTPPVHVEQVVADRRAYDTLSPVRLPSLVRDLEIDYTALSLVAPEKNRFRIKLEGWDRDWQDMGNRRQAFYSNLPPRSYRFRVIASNNSGVWNEAGAFLDFSVAPAYYQTLWFRLTIAAVAVGFLTALYQLRLRRLASEFNVRLEERVNERTRIARDLHDTLLQSFHGVLLRFRAVTYLLPDRPEDARQTLDRVIDDATDAIVDARDAVQGLRASTDPKTTLVDAIAALAKELEAEDGRRSRPQLIMHVEGTPGVLQPLVRDDLYRIAREAVHNAFRHANATHVGVDVRYDRRQFRLRIRDDGKGIDGGVREVGRSGHFGLTGMRERAELLGGTFTLWSKRGSGTEVELTIPASVAYSKE